MECLTPIVLKNAKYETGESRDPFISVPCGKCEICKYNDSIHWRIRLEEEFKACFNCFFVTLTYNDDSVPVAESSDFFGNYFYYAPVCKEDVQKFLKRFRIYWHRKRSSELEKFKYFLVSEYGPTTLRPHYHALFFNVDGVDANNAVSLFKFREKIREIWNLGNIKVDVATHGRISYVTKYLTYFQHIPYGFERPFRLMSRRPAIGIQYLDKKNTIKWHHDTQNGYYFSNGFILNLPRYYKERIFTEEERKALNDKYRDEYYSRILDIPLEQIKHFDINHDDNLSHIIDDYKIHKYEKFKERMKKEYIKKSKI